MRLSTVVSTRLCRLYILFKRNNTYRETEGSFLIKAPLSFALNGELLYAKDINRHNELYGFSVKGLIRWINFDETKRKKDMSKETLRVHSYESMGTVDGPGLRFIIFLQGCNFRCLYCANPDTIDFTGGDEVTLDELFRMVEGVGGFFGKRGGVTFSGGEPTAQAKALVPLIKRFKAAGIHTCIDSNGSIWNSDVEELMTLVDLVLLDVKQIDTTKHKALTGTGVERTLALASWMESHSKPFWLRYVLVPGVSGDREDITKLGEALGSYSMIERVEVLPYHRLGVHKYEVMNIEYKLAETRENTPEELAEAISIFESKFTCPVF